MNDETAKALIAEARDGLAAGASVQILITGYPTWLAINELWNGPKELLHATLADGSGILIGEGAILGVRFGEVEDGD